MAEADRGSFQDMNHGYAKDNNHVYYLETMLELAPNQTKFEHRFAYDNKRIYYATTPVELDAGSFKIEEKIAQENFAIYTLQDNTGEYHYHYFNHEMIRVILD